MLINPSVSIDIDGVILDFGKALQVYLAKRGKTYIPENVTSYSFDGDIGCEKADVFDAMHDLGLWAVEQSYPLEGALDGVNLLKKFITCKSYTAIDIRTEDEYFIQHAYRLRENYCKMIGLKGKPILGNKGVDMSSLALFDDCLGVVKDWLRAGYKGYIYLIDQPYNSEINNPNESWVFERVTRVKNFNEGAKLFVENYIKSDIYELYSKK